jgi:hypothetical protein
LNPNHWRYGQIAPQLLRKGYQPIPLYPESKQPAVTAWPDYHYDQSNLDNRSRPHREGDNIVFPDFATGIVTGEVIGLDIDVRDARVVRRLKLLADRILGPGPDRVGNPPKFLRAYRTELQFKKIRSRGFVLPGEKPRAKGYKPHAIEVLAEGQQFVCEAIHNKTGKPYRWSVAGGLLVTPVSSLTVCTEAQFREFVSEAERILIDCGAKVHAAKKLSRRAEVRPPPIVTNLPGKLRRELDKDADYQLQGFAAIAAGSHAARDPAACRAALASIPNRDEDYELWWRVGLACAAALGEPGRKDFIAWSRKSKKHDQEGKGYTDRAYTGFLKYAAQGKSQITAGSIFHMARKAGWVPRTSRGVSLRRWQRAFDARGMHA